MVNLVLQSFVRVSQLPGKFAWRINLSLYIFSFWKVLSSDVSKVLSSKVLNNKKKGLSFSGWIVYSCCAFSFLSFTSLVLEKMRRRRSSTVSSWKGQHWLLKLRKLNWKLNLLCCISLIVTKHNLHHGKMGKANKKESTF